MDNIKGYIKPQDNTKRICLWSGPRNISTALMYSFAQRSDTKVVDEPLYAHYLSVSNADEYHPGSKEILSTMENDGHEVVHSMLASHESKLVFFKQMTHHLIGLDLSFLRYTTNVILTRDPKEMLPSYAKAISKPTMRDVGYQAHLDLMRYLEAQGQNVIILDSKKVLLHPKETLQKLCKALGVMFDESMLSWEAGAIPEDGCWAPYWYENVHKSVGFQAYAPKNAPFPPEMNKLLNDCYPIYEQLAARSI